MNYAKERTLEWNFSNGISNSFLFVAGKKE